MTPLLPTPKWGLRVVWRRAALSFISLVFLISLLVLLSGVSLVLRGFSPSFPGFSGVRQEQKILGSFGVFLGFRAISGRKHETPL